MKTTNLAILLSAFCVTQALTGCDSGTGSGGTNNSRFGVSDSLLGRWVGIPGKSSSADTINITTDSLSGVWSVGTNGTVPEKIRPYSDAKFYAHNGRMGVTNGQTVQDNVEFEYMFRGETLYVELQNLARASVDGKVETDSTWYTHAWLKRP